DAAGGDDVMVLSPGGSEPVLLHATARNRAALAEFLAGVRPGGRSDPLAGLERALEFRPDAIFLLARGIVRTGPDARWGEGNDTILARLNRLNPVVRDGLRRTAIKAIQFIDDDPTGLMQAIAAAHGNTPRDPAASYTRRDVEGLRREAPALGQVLAPTDPRVARAGEALSEITLDHLDLRVIFGVALEAEREAVAREAERTLGRLLGEGATGEGEVDPIGDDAFARYVAARWLVLAAGAMERGRGERLDRAIELLDTAPGAPPAVLAAAASSRALRRSAGDGGEVEALAHTLEDVAPNSQEVLEARLAAILATAADPARLGVWLLALQRSLEEPPFVDGARRNAALTILAMDGAAKARLDHAPDAAAIDAALEWHKEWWRRPRAGMSADAVLLHAGRLVPEDAPLESIAPELALARGIALMPAPGDPPSRGCLAALDIAAARGDATSGVGRSIVESAMVRAAMAVSLAAQRESERREAIRRLDACLSAFEQRAWRRDAALHVLSHTGALLGAGSDGGIESARLRALRIVVLEQSGDATAHGLEEAARADGWRLELAHRVAVSSREGSDENRRSGEDEALRLLDAGWAGQPPADAARLRAWVHAGRVARLSEGLARARRSGEAGAIHRAATELAVAARAAIPASEPVDPAMGDAMRRDLAEALIALGSPEAAAVYAQIESRGNDAGVDAAIGRARALIAQGDDAGAFGVLREITSAMDTSPPTEPGAARVFWQAWTLLLELLAERDARVQDEGARRTAAAHLLRLADLDPTLGGEPWRSRLGAVGLSVGVTLEARPPVESPP
ncbi:MAG: hypothetical protein KDA05_12670, partial [Phycisphaerales bacterium]|nr:hypothetical protein [Phycisphaerales bacterium]